MGVAGVPSAWTTWQNCLGVAATGVLTSVAMTLAARTGVWKPERAEAGIVRRNDGDRAPVLIGGDVGRPMERALKEERRPYCCSSPGGT